jgi:hypothetical protein
MFIKSNGVSDEYDWLQDHVTFPSAPGVAKKSDCSVQQETGLLLLWKLQAESWHTLTSR